MNHCPICGLEYDTIYGLTQPSTCLICTLNIEISRIQFVHRQKAKLKWSEKMKQVHEEMLQITLHPDRIKWFLPNYQNYFL
jgi:hypothetical protein